MSSLIALACPKQLLDFAGASIGGGSPATILADRVDLLQWREVTAIIDVHSHSLASGAGTISVNLTAQSWTEEDPGTAFLAAASTVTTINSGTPNPACIVQPIPMLGGSPAIARLVRISASATRIAAGALNATISVRLAAKDV